MRDIKFRAWDKKFSVMLDGVAVHDNDNIVVVDVQVNEKYSEDIIDQRLETVEDAGPEHYCITGDIEIMQYTGLKLNGVDIYDGDILGGYPHGTVTVKWDDEYACFSAYWKEVNYDGDGEPYYIERDSLLANDLNDCKDAWNVIGNIYQNPELINALNQQGETNNG